MSLPLPFLPLSRLPPPRLASPRSLSHASTSCRRAEIPLARLKSAQRAKILPPQAPLRRRPAAAINANPPSLTMRPCSSQSLRPTTIAPLPPSSFVRRSPSPHALRVYFYSVYAPLCPRPCNCISPLHRRLHSLTACTISPYATSVFCM